MIPRAKKAALAAKLSAWRYQEQEEGMFNQFWRNSGPRELPNNIKDILQSKYRLDDEVMGRMRLLEKSGSYAGRPVRFVRVFDTTMMPDNPVGALKYSVMDQPDCKKAVMFDGHIEKSGLVLLNDRRARKGQAEAAAAR
jgi:hypothetical protein